MWGGSKGSGWDRTQNRAWSQYNDRQKKESPWQQQSQGGGASGGGGWNQSGGGRSTQAANAWDANAYKRAATGGGGGGGWGGGSGGGFSGGLGGGGGQGMGGGQSAGAAVVGSTEWSQQQQAQKRERDQQNWGYEQQKMDQDRGRREHQQAMMPSHDDFMNQMQSLQQMQSMFPEGWGDDYFKRTMANLVTKYYGSLGGPMSHEDSTQYSWDRMGSYRGF